MTRVLMLHRVIPDEPMAFGRPSCYRLRGTALTPGEFSRLLDSGQFRALDEVIEALLAGEPPPPGHVLTFDDGYREWTDSIAPMLADRAVPATFLVSPAFAQSPSMRAHPVDTFYWLLDHARRSRFEFRLPDDSLACGSLETDEDKAALIIGDLKRRIAHGPPSELPETLSLLAGALGVELPAQLSQQLYPTLDGLRALASAGHRLGGHGTSHRHLTSMDARQASEEISTSLAWACQLSGASTAPFAYPNGAFDGTTERLVEQAGATCALTCRPGPVQSQTGLFQLPREFVTPRSHP
jgi:peptidoglycan/xylan/chitin deacetylase (PgdA/CDA1 family)